MRGHDWKRVSFDERSLKSILTKNDLTLVLKAFERGEYQNLRIWKCSRCGFMIYASGLMSQSDGRRKRKVSANCDVMIAKSIHST